MRTLGKKLGLFAVLLLALSIATAGGPAVQEVFRFVAFGDSGTGESGQYAVAKAMLAHHDEHRFDTALMLGDNIYPNGDPALFKEKFEKPYDKLLERGVLFHAALGNHDVQRGREAQLKYRHFNMNGKAYYSFVKGGGIIEFFALDSTQITREQITWLEGALLASKALWKIAYFHHPVYSSAGTHGSDMKLRAVFEPLFVKFGVAAVLSGHDHTYERTKPQKGVTYFVSGVGGKLRRGDLDRRSPIFEAGDDRVNSFMYFEVTPEKLSFWAIDVLGETLDKGSLIHARAATPAQ